MRTILYVLSLSLLGAQPALAAEAGKPTIAVMDFSPSNVPAGDAVIVSGFIRAAVVRSEKFIVVEKNNMDKVLTEQAFQQTGCTTSDCAVKLGRLLNTRKMVIGEFALLGGVRFLTASLVDVETGAIERTARVKGFEVATADEAADRLVSQLTGVQVSPGSEAMGARPAPGPRKAPARVLKTEWTIGVFGAVGYGFVPKPKGMGAKTWAAPSAYTVSVLPEGGEPADINMLFFNVGLRAYPVRWIMLEGYYSPLGYIFRTDYILNNRTSANPQVSLRSFITGSGGSALYVYRPHPRVHLMAGGGACLLKMEVQGSAEYWNLPGGTTFSLTASQSPENMLVPYGLVGIQWMTPGPGLAIWARYASGGVFRTTGHLTGTTAAGTVFVDETLPLAAAEMSGLYLNFSLGIYF